MGPLPKYWHFPPTTCRRCLQLVVHIYLGCTVSTDHRPPDPYTRVNVVAAPCLGPLPEYWHSGSTTCRQCLHLAGRVYLGCTMSTDYRPTDPCARGNAVAAPRFGKEAFGPPSRILALRVYHMPTVSTISRPCLVGVHNVYRPQTTGPLCTGKHGCCPVFWEGGLQPPSEILALCVYNMPTVSTISRPRLVGVHIVYRPQTAEPVYTGKRCCCPVIWEGGLRTVSRILALGVYSMPIVSTISRPRLLGVHSVYRPQTARPVYTGKRCCYPVFCERGLRPSFLNIGTALLQHADSVDN